MDTVLLSRLQFAAATMFHFLFVPVTLGLSLLIAVMETQYVRTGDEVYRRLARFWGRLFLINFTLGIVTGITLEFQFGTNWSRYSAYVGDVFGSLLAIEATVAFFLESTLIGVWAFGWKRLSPKAHAVVMWLVAAGGNLSALWILVANAWMQHPVGYTLRHGRAELTDLWAIVTQRFAVLEFLHTVTAAYIVSAFVVMGISAWYLLRRQHVDLFLRSFRLALVLGLVASFVEVAEGHLHGTDLAEKQPAKLAALEAHWETGRYAPLYLFVWPSNRHEGNRVAIGRIPGLFSLLATHRLDGEVKGLLEFPKNDRPPVLITSYAFRTMVALGGLFCLLTAYGWWRRERLLEERRYLTCMLWAIPLPYIATLLGWVVAEVGRQPWIVYGVLRTEDAASLVPAPQVLLSLTMLVLLYGILGIAGLRRALQVIRRGPDAG